MQRQAEWTSGLAPAEEQVIAVAPTEPFWTENLLFALYDHDQLVGVMNKIPPLPARRIDPQAAGKPAHVPFFLDSFLIDGLHKLYSFEP